ncbi:MAG: hypothetical protein M3R71_03450 [Actinomycetota bacterium]|nr:hypothetical protein [Actinomycetota bacterium]
MRGRRLILALVATMAAIGVAVWVQHLSTGARRATPVCHATASNATFAMDLEQAANATTVAAVGKRLGMPDHAVTVALAAALQESRLHNLSHGDLDSVGLFQQRPSQGWGTPSEIMVPRYAAAAFYQHLAAVSGWETMSVTDAAQAVQRSAAPGAYAQWEAESRVLAQVLTGEVPAGLACSYKPAPGPGASNELSQAMTLELGSPLTAASVSPSRGWTVATWLVGHAHQYAIPLVAFDGKRWTPSRGSWKSDPAAPSVVRIAATGNPKTGPPR